ncbi:MAG: EAL domain-containing protein [Ghiorsea sp.]
MNKDNDFEEMDLSKRVSEHIIQSSKDAILITDSESKIIRTNPAFEGITGYAEAEVIGKNPRFMDSGYHDAQFFQKMWCEIEANGSWAGEIWDRKKSGEIYPKWLTVTQLRASEQHGCNYIVIFRDLTNERRSKEQIHALSNFDPLTKLPNRAGALLKIDRLTKDEGFDTKLAVFFINIDAFKKVNDSLGFKSGDLLLKLISERLNKMYPRSVARLSADEFLVYLDQVDFHNSEDVIKNILSQLKQPFTLPNGEVFISATIGISFSPSDSSDAEELVQQSSIAMQRAKDKSGTSYSYFDNSDHKRNLYLFGLESDLRVGLEDEQFHLLYQPKMSVQGEEKISSVEALIRWEKDGKIISPVDFIPLAEANGLIIPVSNWVMKEASETFQKKFSQSNIPVAINLSASHFHHPDLIPVFQDILAQSNVSSESIELEITEGTIMDNVDHAISTMKKLRDLGFKLSLDDFGTGYSSLSYLKKFPLNTLKIDRSFITDMHKDKKDLAIVNAVITLAHQLGLDVVAEGVEEKEQLNFLRDAGCDIIQGYYYSPPVTAEKILSMIKKPSGV